MRILSLLLFFSTLPAALALNVTQTSSYSSKTVTISGSYNQSFDFNWWCDDYPQSSAPGRIELYNSSGGFVGRVVGSVYSGSVSLSVTGGSVSNANYSMAVWANDGSPADGDLTGTWNITGLPTGTYTFRFWSYTEADEYADATTVWTQSFDTGGSGPVPPTIEWTTTPSTAVTGQTYTISAHGHSPGGNLAQVNIWKNGVPFAFAGGGDGTDGDSQNPTSDSSPQTDTFTAQAVDADGASSSTINQTVTITSPPNQPPSASVSVDGYGSGGTITIPFQGSAQITVRYRATDPDGNLSGIRYNVWNSTTGYFDNGGGGFAPASGGSGEVDRSVTLNAAGTWYFWTDAEDSDNASGSSGPWTAGFALNVAVADAPPTVSWTSTPGTAASGQTYSVSAHGHDPDGNLTQVNIWKNGVPFAFAGGGNGTDGDSTNPTSDNGPQTVTFTARAVDAAGATSAVISQSVSIAAPPPAQYTLNTSSSGGGTVSGGGTFPAGSTATVTATADAMHDFSGWTGDVSGISDPMSLSMNANKSVQANFALKNFTLTTGAGLGGSVSPGGTFAAGSTATITATADSTHNFIGWSGDASGTTNPYNLTMNANASVQANFGFKSFTLTTAAGPGGSVSAGGTFAAGGAATVTATPDSTHIFAGWSGDAAGASNPYGLTMNANKAVQANFSQITYSLATSASAGGSVTPGGTYPIGTTVTIAESPDAAHYFTNWAGDASGATASIAVYLDRSKSVEAVFNGKSAQTISFGSVADQRVNSTGVGLSASASSGLPVSFSVLTGPASISGGSLQFTGPGAVTIQATQPGNAFYLPASPVTQSFNVIAPVSLKYASAGSRVLLENAHEPNGVPLVVQVPSSP